MIPAVEHYTYRVEWYEPDGEFLGTCTEFPGLSWLAGTQAAALDGIRTAVAETLEDMAETGERIPEPLSERGYSGKFQVRITPTLHRKLARAAAEEGVSLNALVSERLASA
ncbi:type II toxin-antitoxin system HicB family antitoxin [Rhodococcus sp. NPDC056506]|uniref:type II toxin-antitoxin system HicB family antitoxin n=1 Tax=Rhodococcus sp. NPDC056506 TaxID=3345844 RepID=UPI003671AC85